MTIGKLASAAGVKVETVRFYERKGLLPAPWRSRSGYRQYNEDALARLRFILRAKTLGFTLAEIAELLDMYVNQGHTCAEMRQRADRKLAEIDAKIAHLQALRQALANLQAACEGDGDADLDACPIIHFLAEAEQ